MKNAVKLLVVLSALVLSACNEETFNGTISTKETIQLVTKDKKQITLPAGELNAEFKAAKKDRVDIIIKQNGQKQTIPIKVNFSLKEIPSGTHINVTPQISGQLYTLSGDYQVKTTTTPPETREVSCSYEYNHREVCDWETIPGYCRTVSEPRRCDHVTECDPTSSKGNPICKTREYNCTGGGSHEECVPSRDVRRCHTESDTYHGRKDVTSSTTTTTKFYTLDVLDNNRYLGRIQFGKSNSNTQTYNETSCR